MITVRFTLPQDLYKLGARKFGIINVGPVGCLPWVRVLSPTGACADGLNQLAAGFNDALKSMLAGLAANNKMPGLRYSLADLYAFGAGTNLAAFGFVNWDSACCGAGRLNAETDCMPNSPLCANRDGYVFWDNVHPSQRAAMIIAQTFYNGPTQFTAPINFKELAYKN
jgi:phospholipase/lecithinase/hemolysin